MASIKTAFLILSVFFAVAAKIEAQESLLKSNDAAVSDSQNIAELLHDDDEYYGSAGSDGDDGDSYEALGAVTTMAHSSSISNHHINAIVSKLLSRIIRSIRGIRLCLLKPLVEAIRHTNAYAVKLFKLVHNPNGDGVITLPSDILKLMLQGKFDYIGLITKISHAIKYTGEYLTKLSRVAVSYIKCRTGRPSFITIPRK